MKNNAVVKCSVTTDQKGLAPLTKMDEQENKSNCRLWLATKGGTMRWTREIRDNKGENVYSE